MSTFTVGHTYTHSVTFVTTKMLLLLKEIIRDIGLDPGKFANDWASNERAISTWLASRHLVCVILEVFHPETGALVTRWDLDVIYATVGDGALWVDTAGVGYSIAKAGLVPSVCRYDLSLRTTSGRPDVPGWGPGHLRSTEGFRRYSVGASVGGTDLTAQASYWSR